MITQRLHKWSNSNWSIFVIVCLVISLLLIIALQPPVISFFTQSQVTNPQAIETVASQNLPQTLEGAIPVEAGISGKLPTQYTFSFTTIIILFLSSLIHGAAGMGFALFMMPLLVWNGFSLAQASIFTATSGFILSCFMVYELRRYVLWKKLWPTLIPRVGGLLIGIFILTLINGLDKALIRQLLGGVLLITVIVQIAVNVKPRDHVHGGWFWSALGLGGILNGLVGFGGPPVVLWVMAHNWSKIQIRAFLAATYLTIIPFQIILLILTFGQPLATSSLQALFFIPIIATGVLIGVWLGGFMTKARLRRFVQALLLITAIWSLVAPYVF